MFIEFVLDDILDHGYTSEQAPALIELIADNECVISYMRRKQGSVKHFYHVCVRTRGVTDK